MRGILIDPNKATLSLLEYEPNINTSFTDQIAMLVGFEPICEADLENGDTLYTRSGAAFDPGARAYSITDSAIQAFGVSVIVATTAQDGICLRDCQSSVEELQRKLEFHDEIVSTQLHSRYI